MNCSQPCMTNVLVKQGILRPGLISNLKEGYICGGIISFAEDTTWQPQYAAEAAQLGGYFLAKLVYLWYF